MLQRLLGRKRWEADKAKSLYAACVQQARNAAFFQAGVIDSQDGRFDMITLHVVLVIRRLRAEGEAGQSLSQALFDHMFDDLDAALREMGVGDTQVGKKIRAMGEAFYGRAQAYEAALASSEEGDELPAAIARNVPMQSKHLADDIAQYMRKADELLTATPFDTLVRANLKFPDPFGPG